MYTHKKKQKTSVILQSRLCQSPSEKVGDSLKSVVPCGPRSEGHVGRSRLRGEGREGRQSEEDQRQIGNGKDGGGKSSREDTLHNLCSLFCLSSHSLSD